jgi:hypothetical protein
MNFIANILIDIGLNVPASYYHQLKYLFKEASNLNFCG